MKRTNMIAKAEARLNTLTEELEALEANYNASTDDDERTDLELEMASIKEEIESCEIFIYRSEIEDLNRQFCRDR